MSENENTQPDNKAQPDPSVREAMDRLNEQNRILSESTMTDRSKKLTEEQIGDIRQKAAGYIERNELVLRSVAKQVGYSLPVLSDFLASKYAGNNERIAHAINHWMERDARRAEARRPKDYIKTWVAEDIRMIVSQADKRMMMAAIVVPSGAGKTYVLKALTEEMRGIYIYCHRNLTARELMLSLSIALGRRDKHGGSKAELHRWVVQALSGTGRIIFLDEAHQLGGALSCVRAIHDEARVPIVMAGTAEILEHINDRTDGRGQFSSRTIRYNALDSVRNAETDDPEGGAAGRDLFTVEEVQRFFDMKKIRLDRDALMFLWQLACLPNWGCLRLVEHACETIFDADPDLKVVKREHVMTALGMLHGADAHYMERLTRRQAKPAERVRVA